MTFQKLLVAILKPPNGLLVLGGVLAVALSVGLPYYMKIIWEGGLGEILFFSWLLLMPVSVIFGGIVLYFGYTKRRDFTWPLRAIKHVSFAVCLLAIGIDVWFLSRITYDLYIGPRAEVVFPDQFKGRFAILIDDFLQPSLQTAGENYQYFIPGNGVLRKKQGWITPGFLFANGWRTPKKYSTLMRRENGFALQYGTFAYTWLSKISMLEGADGSIRSSHRTWGIVGYVGSPDEIRSLQQSGVLDSIMKAFGDSVLSSL